MENDPPFPVAPLERAILFTRNRASVARRTGFTSMADDLDARASAIEELKQENAALREKLNAACGFIRQAGRNSLADRLSP